MQKMQRQYAQRLLDGGYAFGNRFLSKTNRMLVCSYEEDDYPYSGPDYVATELDNGQLQVDAEGYVIFSRVTPIIDEKTRWEWS